MKRFAEYVSPGHPDKVADYISEYLLDRYIEKDAETRYAVEVQIKGRHVTLAGEVSSKASFSEQRIATFVREAVKEIGYTSDYMLRWGGANTICGDILYVTQHIGRQSEDIARGLKGWGDQGIFYGYANPQEEMCYMPREHAVAKHICKKLYESGVGGIDIKTHVTTNDDAIDRVIVAIPLLNSGDTDKVEAMVREDYPEVHEVIVNGTGRYVKHGPVADCGTTGRKLAVDFYGGACRIGGGSPWTKDGSKADLTLNLYARQLALRMAKKHKCTVYTSLACAIGGKTVDYGVYDEAGAVLDEGALKMKPRDLIAKYRLNEPIYASMAKWGLFGMGKEDMSWEKF